MGFPLACALCTPKNILSLDPLLLEGMPLSENTCIDRLVQCSKGDMPWLKRDSKQHPLSQGLSPLLHRTTRPFTLALCPAPLDMSGVHRHICSLRWKTARLMHADLLACFWICLCLSARCADQQVVLRPCTTRVALRYRGDGHACDDCIVKQPCMQSGTRGMLQNMHH